MTSIRFSATSRQLLNSACIVSVLALAAGASTPAAAQVEYVRVCSLYGEGWNYIPGTDACGLTTGATAKTQSVYGTIKNAPGANASVYGIHSFAYGDQSLALGNNSWAGGDPTSASPGPLGGILSLNGMAPGSSFFNAGTTAVGTNARAGAGAKGQVNATAVGEGSTANAANATAVGEGSNASGSYSTAFGVSSISSGSESVAIGGQAQATQAGSVAMGYKASSTGAGAIAIGEGASATGSVAVGHNAAASNGGAAFGDYAGASGYRSVALGYGASATGLNSVAIGAGSVASGANSVSFGSPSNLRRLTNIAPGTGPNDVVNVQQYNTGLTKTLNTAESYTDQQIQGVDSGFGGLQRKAFSGIAAAVAMGDASMPSAAGKTVVSVHASTFENYQGVGLAFSHRFDTDVPLSFDGGYAHAANEDVGRVGMSVEF